MNAKITQLQIKPKRRNAKGEVMTEKYASITLNVPLDNAASEQDIFNLVTVLDSEMVEVSIKPYQLRLGEETPLSPHNENAIPEPEHKVATAADVNFNSKGNE